MTICLRPGRLAVRAVNQYRRRDVLTYLALRYYLGNSAATSDRWAKEVATDLVLTRTNAGYFKALHFKERGVRNEVIHRPVFLPGANEALADMALLQECARHPGTFSSTDNVYSYELADDSTRCGAFALYIHGLRRRHQAIAEACDNCQGGIVKCVDIQKFYPSISSDHALSAWTRHAEKAGLAARYTELGRKLLSDHADAGAREAVGILTGPMFSHLVANLLLRPIDEFCRTEVPARYFRYVDDITFVGDGRSVEKSVGLLRSRLDELGLNLHEDDSPKTMQVDTQQWLKGRHDFAESNHPVSWKTFVGGLKQLMYHQPTQAKLLETAIADEGFRLPLKTCRGLIAEKSYSEGFRRWWRWLSIRERIVAVSPQSIISEGWQLKNRYQREFLQLLEGMWKIDDYERKRRIPKLRYRASRLIYLASKEDLRVMVTAAKSIPELHFHTSVMETIVSGDVSDILSCGTNAAQAAAQPLRASRETVTATLSGDSEAEVQALAVFAMNGVEVQTKHGPHAKSELLELAKSGGSVDLMKSPDPFVRELACLHGCGVPRHAELLETAFDEDEDLVLDTIVQFHQSVSL
jgi:hypothetical protein